MWRGTVGGVGGGETAPVRVERSHPFAGPGGPQSTSMYLAGRDGLYPFPWLIRVNTDRWIFAPSGILRVTGRHNRQKPERELCRSLSGFGLSFSFQPSLRLNPCF